MSFLNTPTQLRKTVEEALPKRVEITRVEQRLNEVPAEKHWYYPSAIIGCGLSIDDLNCHELTCWRSEVTCPACLEQLSADLKICEACRRGHPENAAVYLSSLRDPHVCDPALA